MDIFFPKEPEYESRATILPDAVSKLSDADLAIKVEEGFASSINISDKGRK